MPSATGEEKGKPECVTPQRTMQAERSSPLVWKVPGESFHLHHPPEKHQNLNLGLWEPHQSVHSCVQPR